MIGNAGNAIGMPAHIFPSRIIRREKYLPKSRCANAMWFWEKHKRLHAETWSTWIASWLGIATRSDGFDLKAE